ncbi:DUF1573 domain-containing protein [Tuwongella immobilis]|uniref:DUF1573 domain-containing protein n=1 Tax=Tuwongella immobilis TaxID=692036 RepID=A0A6C2YRX2_9BACT|nr:DUF1573 domain-containing protein [Tuwongella immobilis]VIP04226.1 Uncharacterized protein OS=Singulisphaera acidiphila (strain ATCC BAA-1392 / DSM 18658 / VKM B-2454 / MOB10) GN=Sinac_5340 PE=4 SV=1: DUF1573 [Tuwongella immobilis]VTS05816.1 Uncharacterized protein OS=Singulisphaera acidiphila (strain ATCC BAA-1392 / DSM 18658 / VKM B-2454 / MOB10) GN=Sinac_5340 PE=4 SV=1: DUF1573 [Tuwongella immobilis]
MIRQMMAACLVLASTGMLSASEMETWFSERVKDFGTVPKGPVLTHYFRITNPTNQPIQIGGVRVSCGCVSASATQNTIPPGQSAAILAQMDTRRYSRPVTIFVTFLAPRMEEVTLQVMANTRLDLVMNPEVLTFSQMTHGREAQARVRVSVYGDPAFRILKATSESTLLSVEAKAAAGQSSETAFDVVATASAQVPVGRWFADVNLETTTMGKIRVPVSIEVLPSLSAAPSNLTLGSMSMGQSTEQRVILKGPEPFKVLQITGVDDQVKVTKSGDEARPVQVLTISVTPKKSGLIDRTIRIETDLKGDKVVEIPVRAEVSPNP